MTVYKREARMLEELVGEFDGFVLSADKCVEPPWITWLFPQ